MRVLKENIKMIEEIEKETKIMRERSQEKGRKMTNMKEKSRIVIKTGREKGKKIKFKIKRKRRKKIKIEKRKKIRNIGTTKAEIENMVRFDKNLTSIVLFINNLLIFINM